MVASADPSMPQVSGIEGSARGEKRGRTMVMGKKSRNGYSTTSV